MTEYTASNGVKIVEDDTAISVRVTETGTKYIGHGFFGKALKEYIEHRGGR